MLDREYREILSDDELKFLRETREFMQTKIAPHAVAIDRDDEVPIEVFEALKPYMSVSIPKAYGGQGHGLLYDCLVIQELGAVCPALVTFIEVAQLFSHAVEIGGSEAQKRRYLGRLCEGIVGAYALTDEGPGSDPAQMTTVARREGEGWRIQGGKRHITFADIAELMVVFAQTPDEGEGKSLGAFIIEAPYEGVKLRRRSEWSGLRGHKAWELDLDCYSTELIGAPDQGLKIALGVLNSTRTTLAAGHLGLAQSALDMAVRFAKEREVGGRPIFHNQAISFPLIEVAAQIEGARLLTYRAARMHDAGRPHRAETSMAKFAAAEALIRSVTVANRVLGGFSGNLDYPGDLYLRDAFTWVAAHGTIEVQKLTAARGLFSSKRPGA
ncbi:MAG: acyl-CoA dehydrogenase family protein [Myxococcota bacterium]|nr:acyl-CoA dehydrogenase family protein [Myxococcota bacterium]